MDRFVAVSLLTIFIVMSLATLFFVPFIFAIVDANFAKSTHLEPIEIRKSHDLPIAEFMEFDGLNRSDILSLRTDAVHAFPQFAPPDYSPSEGVFSRIADGKPWWGTLGLSFYGPGNMSNEGPSYHSLHVLNPHLLVGVGEPGAFVVEDYRLSPQPIFPKIVSLKWSADGSKAHAVYDYSEYLRTCRQYRTPDVKRVNLYAYNAFDLGYKCLYVDLERSTNVYSFGHPDAWIPLYWNPDRRAGEGALRSWLSLFQRQGDPALIRQTLGGGGRSCGYTGGCNNIMQFTPELALMVFHLPARAHIKLWRKCPKSPLMDADMVYILDLT